MLVQSAPTAKGLTDKREYNAFLVMVEPQDTLASLVFRVASGTQVSPSSASCLRIHDVVKIDTQSIPCSARTEACGCKQTHPNVNIKPAGLVSSVWPNTPGPNRQAMHTESYEHLQTLPRCLLPLCYCQVLDYVTSVLMGGGKGFLPHLHAGMTAACLVRRLGERTALTDFQWGQTQQMAHTLCIRHVNAAKGVGAKLLQGQANPEDAPSKFILALLRICRSCSPAGSAGAAGQD